MVATSDFSGLTSAACAFASAVASAATVSLERGMGCLCLENVEAHGAGFRTFSPHAVTDRFLRVFGHQRLELALGAFMIEKGRARVAVQRCKLSPGVRRGHIHDPHSFNARPRRLRIDEVWRLTELHAAPEFLFR